MPRLHRAIALRGLVLLLAVAGLAAARSGAADPGVDSGPAIDWDALARGDVLVEAVESDAGLPGVRARFTVKASPERIWATLVDYEHFPQIFAGIERMQVLDQDAAGATIEFWVDAVLTHYHCVLRRDYDPSRRRLRWSRVSGDLERIEGSWEIRDAPQPGAKLLVYESYVKVGRLVPTSMIRWLALRNTRQMGERMRAWLQAPAAQP